jgi:flavin-binding protein dodecin
LNLFPEDYFIYSRVATSKEKKMTHNTYKKIELTGTSSESIEDAVGGAIAKAAKTVRQMRWFEVIETRGVIDDDEVAEWQVTVKIGFTLEA